jgi:hypothetical protein
LCVDGDDEDVVVVEFLLLEFEFSLLFELIEDEDAFEI